MCGVGGRADHRERAARAAAAARGRVPGRRRPRQAAPAGAPELGADRGDAAQRIAHEQWRTNVFRPPVCWDLELPEHFDVVAEHVTPEQVASVVDVSADLNQHAQNLHDVRRARLRRDLPAPRRQGPDPVHRRVRRERAPGGDRRDPHVRRLVEERRHLLPRRGDLLGQRRFRGLTEHIDHLHALGVTCVWLMPFYPTPERDDGYDITDFYAVDPRLGSLGDFVEFVRAARDRGMRVIADLVVNHTSDQHPWFHDESPSATGTSGPTSRQTDGPQGITFPDKENIALGVLRGGRQVLPAPFLQAPARPQRLEPRGARRDRADHGVLDGAGL